MFAWRCRKVACCHRPYPQALNLSENPRHNVMTTCLFMKLLVPFLAAAIGFGTRQEGNATESLENHMSFRLNS